jgi:hypothetical protein
MMHNGLNKSGIYRRFFPVLDNDGKTRRVSFYCLDQSGSTAKPAEWGSCGGGRTEQAICHSAWLDKYTPMSADVKKSPREEARTKIRRSNRTAPKGRKIVSTPKRQPNSVSAQQDVSPLTPKRHPNIVSEQKGLPSSAPEQPPNDLKLR